MPAMQGVALGVAEATEVWVFIGMSTWDSDGGVGARRAVFLQKVKRLQMQSQEAGVTFAGWDFVLLAFDAQRNIEQVVSYSIRSCSARAILSQLPSRFKVYTARPQPQNDRLRGDGLHCRPKLMKDGLHSWTEIVMQGGGEGRPSFINPLLNVYP